MKGRTMRCLAVLLVAVLPNISGCGVLDADAFALGRGSGAGDAATPAPGAAALHLGMTGLAVAHFDSAVAQDPRSAAAWNGLGAAYDLLGRRDLARGAYAQALALAPGSAEALNNMGASYHADGRHDLAVAMLRGASARDAADPVIAANRNAAERALAAAGGPPPRSRWGARSQRDGTLRAVPPFKPRIERTGRGELTLVTRPPPAPPESPAVTAAKVVAPAPAAETRTWQHLPDYLAAPLRIDAPRFSTRAAQAARERSIRP